MSFHCSPLALADSSMRVACRFLIVLSECGVYPVLLICCLSVLYCQVMCLSVAVDFGCGSVLCVVVGIWVAFAFCIMLVHCVNRVSM